MTMSTDSTFVTQATVTQVSRMPEHWYGSVPGSGRLHLRARLRLRPTRRGLGTASSPALRGTGRRVRSRSSRRRPAFEVVRVVPVSVRRANSALSSAVAVLTGGREVGPGQPPAQQRVGFAQPVASRCRRGPSEPEDVERS